MTTTHNQSVGRWGEARAAEYLSACGYHILGRNLRTPYGEIDLLAQQGGQLVFVEVKTRTSRAFGNPEEAVTARKREHLLAAAQHYLQEHPALPADWRVDVIAIYRPESGLPPEVTHFENILT
ncbi:MAG: YraN family protein [Anaerolineales bacterium]